MADLPPPPTDVEIVVVHPPRLAPLGGEAVFSAVQVGPEILRATPRLDEALKGVPGVSLFRRTGSGAANPTTQGLSLRSIAPSGAGRALVTLDGAPQNDPFGGWVIWSALPPEGLEGATIVRGAGAGSYGAGALTGVVALQERGAASGIAAAEVSGGERSTYRVAASGGSSWLLLTGSASSTRGYYAVRGPRRGAADTRVSLDDASFAVRAQHTVRGVDAALRLSVFEERRGAGLVGAASVAEGRSASLTLAQPASAGGDEAIGGWRLQAWVRESDLANSSVAVAANRATTTPANDQYETPATGYGFNAALQGKAGPLAWEVGGDVRATDGEDRERFRLISGAFTRGRIAGGETFVGGVYAEGVLEQGPWLVTGGARLDGWKSTNAVRREWDLATNARTLDSRAPDADGTTPTGRLGVRYEIADALWLRAAAYGGFRPPTLNELHRPFRVGNDITEANPLLKPETLQGIEAGLGGDGAITWRAGLFYNRLKDPITNVTLLAGPATHPIAGVIPAGGVLRQRQNAGEITAWGYEGEGSGRIGATGATWRMAVAYTDAEVDGGSAAPQLTGKRPAQTPRWTITGGVDVPLGDRVSLEADARYESARWEDDLNSRKLSAGVQADVRARWQVSGGWEAFVAAENLFDDEIEVGETADGVESYAAPRTLRVGITFRR